VWTDGLAGLMGVDVRDALANVTVPTLVAVGDHDRVTPPGAAMILVSDLPNARLEIVEGAGHLAMLERPDAVNDMLAQFSSEVLTRRTTRKRPGTTR
jgi:3-oxoadipate enol-lactonase